MKRRAFVNRPDIFTLIQLVLFFGRDVEKFIGRKAFAWLYGVLVLAVPVLLSLLYFLGIDGGSYSGSDAVHFAIFLAFAMIYPGAEIFFSIQARWTRLLCWASTRFSSWRPSGGSAFRSSGGSAAVRGLDDA